MRERAGRTAFDVPVDPLPIFLRGYVVRDAKAAPADYEAEQKIGPSKDGWTLTFDCETTTDEAQALRFGAYQLRKGDILKEQGLFHGENIPDHDMAVLRAVKEERGVRLRSVRHFVDYVLLDKIYDLGGVVIGFNLPFDLSRLAIRHGSAQKGMRGGFSLQLSRNTDWPRVRVKHVSRRLAFIRFGAPPKKRTPKGQKKRGLAVPPRRGYFVDVHTMAAALLSDSFTLERLTDTLKTVHRKRASDDHGEDLTPEYVAYGLNDVQATWECYRMLADRLASYRLSTIEPHTLFSEASLGKAYLKAMNITPWQEAQPDFPPEMIGQIMSSYFGGRAEVHIRRRRTRVLYCDFLSMYPTVCTNMGLWRFVIAKEARYRDATAETQAFLNWITPDALFERATWSSLTTLVQLCPDDDVLPVRARYGGEGGYAVGVKSSSTIGVNRLTSAKPLWFTLADVVASKVLSGKTPQIMRAIRFDHGERQDGLLPVNVAGREDYYVNPNGNEDFYKRIIDLRQTVKAKRDAAPDEEKAVLDAEQLALKILANATSYGIFIEMVVQTLDKSEVMTAYGVDGEGFPTTAKKYEEPGPFFHPLLGSLITGAARLMLALAERRALDEGLDWVFCDTDSLAIARPDGMADSEFLTRARRVCEGFERLNPYEAAEGSVLQVEDVNFAPGRKGDWSAMSELWCFAVSAKRYALFNRDRKGKPIIRKASAHGLGHLLPPYHDRNRKRRAKRLKDLKVDLWQEDLWKRIIIAGEEPGEGVIMHQDRDRRLQVPAASRYAATTPDLLRWFTIHNRGLAYEQRVRPFGFLLSFQVRKPEQTAASDDEAALWELEHKRKPAPVAPFNRDPAKAAKRAFDRKIRNKKIPERWLMSYATALAQYHLQPETKFRTGETDDKRIRKYRGVLQRRHVIAGAPRVIGKEADRWEEQRYVGPDDGDDIEYELSPEARARHVESIKLVRKRFSIRKLRRAARVSDHTITAAASGRGLVHDSKLERLAEAAGRLAVGLDMHTAEEAELVEWGFEEAIIEGAAPFAERIGAGDPSNMMKAFRGRRGVPKDLLAKLRAARARWTEEAAE